MTTEPNQKVVHDRQTNVSDAYFYLSRRGRGRAMRRGGGGGNVPHRPRPLQNHSDPIEREISWSELCERHRTLLANTKGYLPDRQISEEVYEAVYAKDIGRLPHLVDHDRTRDVDRACHRDLFDQLLKVETVHQDVEMRRHDLRDKMINLKRCSLEFPGLSNGQPSLVPGDYAIFYDDNFVHSYIMPIKSTIGDFVIFYESRCLKYKQELSKPLNVAFYSSGVQLEMCRLALIRSSENLGICEIIWDNHDGEPMAQDRRVIELDPVGAKFLHKINSRKGDSCLEKLFRIEDAYSSTRKVYVINPELEPRKCYFVHHKGDTFTFNYRSNDRSCYPSGDDSVIIQNPETLDTIILPCKDRSTAQIMEDGRDDILNVLSKPNLDFVFIARSLVEKSGSNFGLLPQNQPSLRELLHECPEDIDSRDGPHKIDVRQTDTRELSERLEKLNKPQQQAIKAILEARLRPKPYILFGPPGTGKTHTLVEAVVQIYKRDRHAKILFVANSNTCADQILEKLELTGIFDENDYERIRAGDSVSGKGFRRIIVTTNMKSGGFIAKSTKFDYVIIDEAGHAHEPETLIPLSSLETSDGVLVLAGDPQQLGPVVMNHQAGELGLNKSMLERIFKFKTYDKDRPYGRYNKYCISKLLYSYRCDPAILDVSNRLFYGNELKCVNNTPASLLKILNFTKPVQFHHAAGREYQPPWSKSWRNPNEVQLCLEVLMRLLSIGLEPTQIGVITPYKLQAKEITNELIKRSKSRIDLLKKRYPAQSEQSASIGGVDPLNDLINSISDLALESRVAKHQPVKNSVCKVDTVDAFQGNEREIIIISTVRTDKTKRLDFLNDARRFNVAISRAKWLVIVIGQREILQQGEFWPEYLKIAEKDGLSRWPNNMTDTDPFKIEKPLFRL